MNDYRIEAKTPGHDWRTLGTHRDDITQRDNGMPAERLTRIVTDRLADEYPTDEFRAVVCEVPR